MKVAYEVRSSTNVELWQYVCAHPQQAGSGLAPYDGYSLLAAVICAVVPCALAMKSPLFLLRTAGTLLHIQDWAVVRDIVNHEWRVQSSDAADQGRTYLRPRFVKGCSFHFMQPAGAQHTQQQSISHLMDGQLTRAAHTCALALSRAAPFNSCSQQVRSTCSSMLIS
jgi:hypothetical protein